MKLTDQILSIKTSGGVFYQSTKDFQIERKTMLSVDGYLVNAANIGTESTSYTPKRKFIPGDQIDEVVTA